ncbi:MAG: hypothetical protein WBM07_06550, partial [Chitinivibrionales bacterium]
MVIEIFFILIYYKIRTSYSEYLSRYLKISMEVSTMVNRIKLQVLIFVFLFVGAGYCDSLPNCKVYYENNQIEGVITDNNGKVITIPWNGGVEVNATVVIDSIVNNKIAFSVLSLSQIDTSIYYSAPTALFSRDTGTQKVIYDTSEFPRHHLDSLIALFYPILYVGEQFKNVFILQISPYNG